MQIPVGAGDLDLHVRQALEAVEQRRLARREHRGVGDHHGITGQPLAGILDDVALDTVSSYLLFALDQELDVDRQLSPCLKECLHRLDMGIRLSLVIGGPTADQ